MPHPVELDPEPFEELERLHRVDARVAERVERVLDLIEADPGAAVVRRRRIRPPGLWMVTIDLDDRDDLMLLWDLDGETPVVRHLGPSVFP